MDGLFVNFFLLLHSWLNIFLDFNSGSLTHFLVSTKRFFLSSIDFDNFLSSFIAFVCLPILKAMSHLGFAGVCDTLENSVLFSVGGFGDLQSGKYFLSCWFTTVSEEKHDSGMHFMSGNMKVCVFSKDLVKVCLRKE